MIECFFPFYILCILLYIVAQKKNIINTFQDAIKYFIAQYMCNKILIKLNKYVLRLTKKIRHLSRFYLSLNNYHVDTR